MSHLRPGYFRLPPNEIGATLVFIPAFSKGLSAAEIALWARGHGYGELKYIPAKAVANAEVRA